MDTGFYSGEDLKMKRKQYSAEFKKEAAKMIIIEGTAVREVSEQLAQVSCGRLGTRIKPGGSPQRHYKIG